MTLTRGLLLFLGLSVVALIGIFAYASSPASVAELVERADPLFLVWCLLGVPIADWLIAGLRMYLFTLAVAPLVSYAACVRNCAVGGFVTAATPSQTGGGIAQVYVLVRSGATLSQALTILFMTFLSTLIFYFTASLAMWSAAAIGLLTSTQTRLPFFLAAAVFGSLSGLGILTLIDPARARAGLGSGIAWLRRRRLPTRLADRATEVLEECGDSLRAIGRRRGRIVLSLLLTAGVFGNRYLAAYLAAQALGLAPPFVELMAIQVVLHIVLYFFPTPGGGGAAEVGAAAMMAPLVPTPLLPAFTLLWRSATSYLTVLVGGLILAGYLRRDAASRTARDSLP